MGLGDKIVGDGAERGIIGGTVPIVGKEDNLECLRQDNTIQPEGPVANVPRFKLNTIFEGNVIPPVHLPEIIATVRGVAQGEAICPPKLCAPLFQLVSREFRQRSGRADYEAGTNYGLTYRQRQLVVLVAKGLTNKEIATSLNLSEFTVKNHIRRILRQVDAQTRYEAVDVIRASGFLPSA